jgi:hypothetical protein
MMPDDPNATIDRADNNIIPSEPIADAAQVSRDTDVVAPQGAASDEPSPDETALSHEELAGLSDQLAERGINLKMVQSPPQNPSQRRRADRN